MTRSHTVDAAPRRTAAKRAAIARHQTDLGQPCRAIRQARLARRTLPRMQLASFREQFAIHRAHKSLTCRPCFTKRTQSGFRARNSNREPQWGLPPLERLQGEKHLCDLPPETGFVPTQPVDEFVVEVGGALARPFR